MKEGESLDIKITDTLAKMMLTVCNAYKNGKPLNEITQESIALIEKSLKIKLDNEKD